jgi:hypothetical protein
MTKHIYYITSDFVGTEEFFDSEINPTIETLEKWCDEGKAEKYTIEGFVQAFNDEYISDLGMLFYM